MNDLNAADFSVLTKDFPSLARANLLAASLEIKGSVQALNHTVDIAKHAVMTLAIAVAGIDASNVLRDINEDRALAGFPAVSDEAAIEEQLYARQRYYRETLHKVLDQLPTKDLIALVNDVVSKDTDNGQTRPTILIENLINTYEIGAQPFFEAEMGRANILIERIRKEAINGESKIQINVTALINLLHNWRSVAKPLMQASNAIGLDHGITRTLATNIRSLSVDIYNQYSMLSTAEKLSIALKNQVSELSEFADRVDSDIATLINNRELRRQSEQREIEYNRSITYSCNVGLFGAELSISPQGLSWKGTRYPLNDIINVAWGGTRHSVNGIPTGTTYEIRFGTSSSDVRVEMRDKDAYEKLIDCFWKAVGIRLMFEYTQKLREGGCVTFPDIIMYDRYAILYEKKLFKKAEPIQIPWGQIVVWSSGGSLFIGRGANKSINAKISYTNNYNTHIVEIMLRQFFKNDKLNISSIMD